MIVTAETFIPALFGLMLGLMVIFIASLWVIKRYMLSASLAILAACAVFTVFIGFIGSIIWFCTDAPVDKPDFIPRASNEVISGSNTGINFESLTVTGYSVGSPVPCSYSSNGSVDGSASIQLGSVNGDMDTSFNWYAYPMTVPVDSQKSGSIASFGILFDNLSANCSVNLSSPATNGGNKYILNAKADFNNGVSESFGIAGGKVRFSGLQYGKSYAFGDKSLEVAEDGTAEVEFTVPDYGYVDSMFPDLYSVRLVKAEGNSLETELILYIKRPIKRAVDVRAGK